MRQWFRSLNPNQQTLVQTLSVVAVMGTLGFASSPLYDMFCRVTGFGGTPSVGNGQGVEILDRTMTVRFDASLEADMPWEFRPMQRQMEVRIGEVGLAFYEAYNPTDRPIAGSASYNVAPYAAGGYFTKIDCFCFEEQVLAPGERVEMPVTFYIDPEITQDADGSYVKQITLSYTFHTIDLPESTELADASEQAVN